MDQAELDAINEWLGNTLDDLLTDVIDAAMTRCQVKKSRRPHVRKVVEEAFKIALERASR